MFQDHGAVGRIPYLIPVAWKNKWPIFGDNGSAPDRLDIPVDNLCFKIVASDEFGESELPLVWQWNHNPVDEYWSLTERPGYLRLINDRIDKSVVETRNTLTQRTFGPRSSGIIAVDTSNMKDGDVAGLAAFQKNYAYVGVKKTGNSKSIVMVNASSDSPVEVQNIPVDQDRVYFKIEFDFRFKKDEAYFFYSLDGEEWTRIGNILKMTYTLPHFMGYRFALFNYATKSTGGYVDFDYFKVKDTIEHKSWTFF